MLGLIISVVLAAMVVWTAVGAMRRGELEVGERTLRRDQAAFWVVTGGGLVAGCAIAGVSLRAYWDVHLEDGAPPQQLVRDGVRITLPGSWRPLEVLDEGMGASRDVLAVGGDGAELVVVWPPEPTSQAAAPTDLREVADELKSPALSYDRWDVETTASSVVIDAVYPSPRGRVRLRHVVFSRGGRPRVVTATCSTEGEARICDMVVASLEAIDEEPALAPSASGAGEAGSPRGLAVGDNPCALRANGTVRCWGGPEAPATLGLSDVHQIAGAGTHRCAVHGKNRDLACWRAPAELGPSNDGAPALHEVRRVALAQDFGCATHGPRSELSCWGAAAPAPPPANDVVDLGVGGAHVCALTRRAEVICVGEGSVQLGPDTRDGEGRFTLRGALALTASPSFTCALLATHQPWCWGVGFGPSASGDAPDAGVSASPLRIDGVDEVVEMVAGGAGACARLQTGSVTCWGGRLRERPLDISETESVAVGDTQVCAFGRILGRVQLGCWADDGVLQVVPPAVWAE